MKKSLILATPLLFVAISAQAVAMPIKSPELLSVGGPAVSHITSTSAIVSTSDAQLISIDAKIKPELQKNNLYFEYGESRKACPAIYPPTPDCAPKQTEKGQATVKLTNLKPDTWYYVRYVKDTNIYCIKAPCPTDVYTSPSTEFHTLPKDMPAEILFTRTLKFGMRGADVRKVQDFLFSINRLKATPNGYYGTQTRKAVSEYQLLSAITLRASGNVDRNTWTAMFGNLPQKEPIPILNRSN